MIDLRAIAVGASCGFAQILGPHDHALTTHRKHQNGPGVWVRASARLAVSIKCLEVLCRLACAGWLPPDEREWLVNELQAELKAKKKISKLHNHGSVL